MQNTKQNIPEDENSNRKFQRERERERERERYRSRERKGEIWNPKFTLFLKFLVIL